MAFASEVAQVSEMWPLLMVADLAASLGFYRNGLGFSVVESADSEGAVYWCRIRRGAVSLMLQQANEAEDGPAEGRGRGVVFYVLCDDANRIHAEFRSNGLAVAPPTTAHYGMRQVEVTDPDGYSLCFESRVSPA